MKGTAKCIHLKVQRNNLMDTVLNCLCLWFVLSIPSTFIVAKTLKHRGEGNVLYPVGTYSHQRAMNDEDKCHASSIHVDKTSTSAMADQ
jgi:hypothetical protein